MASFFMQKILPSCSSPSLNQILIARLPANFFFESCRTKIQKEYKTIFDHRNLQRQVIEPSPLRGWIKLKPKIINEAFLFDV